mmetsp:Transcript_2900/g.2794  ORF Transcript_2900/g.2794 Transcript_2900/m.2794 type:complete len:83 (+) Transcript_2900:141-389(+)
MPYTGHIRFMTKSLGTAIQQWLKKIPSTRGVIVPQIPANIIEGTLNPDFKRKRIAFGAYTMVYIGMYNTMQSRAVPAIGMWN